MGKETCKNILSTIQSPDDLRRLKLSQLPQLCNELRQFIIDELSHNPGHFGSTLGVIELTVALHYVYNTPNDRLVWDVGHQAYAHKILTGRREQFHTNRQYKGLKPFPPLTKVNMTPSPVAMHRTPSRRPSAWPWQPRRWATADAV